MIPTSTTRHWTLWVVGLFIVAQLFAVVPLISEHTVHVAQSELGISLDGSRAGNIPQGHHRGDADGFIQHHELQDLSGVLTCAVSQSEIGLIRVVVFPPAPDVLAKDDPIFLERPPKSLLSA